MALRIVKMAIKQNKAYLPIASYQYPQGAGPLVENACNHSISPRADFSKYEIQDHFIYRQLRPDGDRNPMAEANILGRMKAIANGYTMQKEDIENK